MSFELADTELGRGQQLYLRDGLPEWIVVFIIQLALFISYHFGRPVVKPNQKSISEVHLLELIHF
jgi:hypothetical protein